MSNFDYSKEAHKLIEFAQRCIETVPKDNDSFKRMEIELKNRKEFRKTLRSLNMLEKGRYDLVDDCTFKEHIADYPGVTRTFAKVDPNSCKIEYEPPKLGLQERKNSKDRRSDAKRDHFVEKKRQKLMEGAEQNTSLVKTLLGSPYYVDLTHSPPPPPPPPPLPAVAPPPNLYEPQPQINLGGGPSLPYHSYPVANPGIAPAHTYLVPTYQQQPFLTPQYSIPPPGPHLTSTLPPPSGVRHEKTPSQVSKPMKSSRKSSKQKLPKSLRKMGKVAKRYDLDT
ncbi:hypothetical protein ZYGR_0U02350 [Zygosaccharomyces rouxii]|uniref:Uncharacterized protein n=1 Tax=Zygosaccharomyces rouxii TaxID=4956 RepID=A0A1Q3A3X7_ZYGRO|nr:hypothetical protein ZYGR_0U02350 [Zygosaccharomyces rouxii]